MDASDRVVETRARPREVGVRSETSVGTTHVLGDGAAGSPLAGLRVALVEQNDLGSGTSSHSTKLIHGGLRYLERAAFGLVSKALVEREVLLRMAPHLIRPMRFILPVDPKLRSERMLQLGCTDIAHWQRWIGRIRLTRNGLAVITLDQPFEDISLIACTEQILELPAHVLGSDPGEGASPDQEITRDQRALHRGGMKGGDSERQTNGRLDEGTARDALDRDEPETQEQEPTSDEENPSPGPSQRERTLLANPRANEPADRLRMGLDRARGLRLGPQMALDEG